MLAPTAGVTAHARLATSTPRFVRHNTAAMIRPTTGLLCQIVDTSRAGTAIPSPGTTAALKIGSADTTGGYGEVSVKHPALVLRTPVPSTAKVCGAGASGGTSWVCFILRTAAADPQGDGVLRPEIAALTMAGSSFLVAVNALTLKRLRLPTPSPAPSPQQRSASPHPLTT